MVDRITTGIPELDSIIEGGFPASSAILIVGPPGSGKSTLCQQCMFSNLKQNRKGLYITLDISPQEIMENMEHFGWKLDNLKEILNFVDAYSWRVGKEGTGFAISNLGDINELNIVLSKALAPDKSSVAVFDSVSTLLLYSDPALVIKMIPIIIAKGKAAGFTQLLVLEEGVHDPKTVTTLNYVADGLIEFKMEEDKRFLRVSRMVKTEHTREWVEFDITSGGIKMKEKK